MNPTGNKSDQDLSGLLGLKHKLAGPTHSGPLKRRIRPMMSWKKLFCSFYERT